MATVTILVKNQTGSKKQYALFQATPETPNLPPSLSNVWLLTGETPSPHGTQTISISQDVFAVCGTTPETLAAGVSVSQLDFAGPASAGPLFPTVQVIDGDPAFDPPPYTQSISSPSSALFGIAVGAYDAQQYPNIVVGMGKYDANNNVVPVYTVRAEPSMKYEFARPVPKYYVASEQFAPGSLVDVTAFSALVEIDFSKVPPGQTYATITQNQDLSWTGPVFSAPPGQHGRLKSDRSSAVPEGAK